MSDLRQKITDLLQPVRTMSNVRRKMIAYVIVLLGTAWQFRYLPSLTADDRKIALFVLFLFDAIILVGLTFAATVQPEQDGIRVEQFGRTHLNFTEIVNCVIVPFFPQSFVLVTTNRRFPLNILFCPLTLSIESGGKVETVKLTDFLRSHGSAGGIRAVR